MFKLLLQLCQWYTSPQQEAINQAIAQETQGEVLDKMQPMEFLTHYEDDNKQVNELILLHLEKLMKKL